MWFEISIVIISTLSLFIQSLTLLTICTLSSNEEEEPETKPMTEEIRNKLYS